ncbi:MAG: hypothetical protein WCJ44_19575, partial [Runella sp.]
HSFPKGRANLPLHAIALVGKLVKIYFTFFTSRVFRASTFRFGEHLLYIPQELGLITIFIRATRSIYNFLLFNFSGSEANLAKEPGK